MVILYKSTKIAVSVSIYDGRKWFYLMRINVYAKLHHEIQMMPG